MSLGRYAPISIHREGPRGEVIDIRKPLLTPSQVAAIFGWPVKQIYKYIEEGHFPDALLIRFGERWYFHQGLLREWLDGQASTPKGWGKR
jgi:hypothetical protein